MTVRAISADEAIQLLIHDAQVETNAAKRHTLLGLADSLRGFQQRPEWFASHLTPTDPMIQEARTEMLREYSDLMVRAARQGLIDHPVVKYFFAAQRVLGEQDLLKRANLPGTRHPFSEDEFDMIQMRWQGKTWSHIYREMTRRGVVPKKTIQAFFDWIDRREVRALGNDGIDSH